MALRRLARCFCPTQAHPSLRRNPRPKLRQPAFIELLRKHDIGLFAAWATGNYAKGRRACSTEAHSCPRDVYVYFDNDIKVRAPFDAQALQAKINQRLGS